jgi:hypothetical protein
MVLRDNECGGGNLLERRCEDIWRWFTDFLVLIDAGMGNLSGALESGSGVLFPE